MVYRMYTENEIKNTFNVRALEINENRFLISKDGNIFRKMKSGNWKQIENKKNHNKGFNVILIDKKQYMRSRLVAKAYFRLNEDLKYYIQHKNGDKLMRIFTI